MPSVATSRTPRVVVYSRVSTGSQADAEDVTRADGEIITRETSLNTQEAACRALAEEQGWHVEAAFSDTFSGHSLFERPGLSDLRAHVSMGGVEHVIVYAMDRLSRKMGVVAFLSDELTEVGCTLVFVTEKYSNDSTGKLLQAFQEWRGESEREAFRERSLRGKRAKARAGAFLPGNRPRYGYKWAGGERTRFEVDPITGDVVRRIFALAANGDSLRNIALTLTREGVPTPTGQGTIWMHSVVRAVLTDEMYVGRAFAFRRSGRTVRSKHGTKYQRQFEQPEDQRIALPSGTVPPLVDEETFVAIGARLERNKVESTRRNANPEASLLRAGHIFCGACERTMVVKNAAYGQYRCVSNAHEPGRCLAPAGISLRTADDIAWARVRTALLDQGLVAREVERLALDDGAAERDVIRIDKLLAEIDRKRRNLAANLADLDPDSASEIRAMLRGLSDRRHAIEAERTEAQTRHERRQENLARVQAIQMWQGLVATNLDSLDYSGKRNALVAVGLRMTVWQKGHEPRWTVTMNIDPSTIVDSSRTRSAQTCTSTTCTGQSSIWPPPS